MGTHAFCVLSIIAGQIEADSTNSALIIITSVLGIVQTTAQTVFIYEVRTVFTNDSEIIDFTFCKQLRPLPYLQSVGMIVTPG